MNLRCSATLALIAWVALLGHAHAQVFAPHYIPEEPYMPSAADAAPPELGENFDAWLAAPRIPAPSFWPVFEALTGEKPWTGALVAEVLPGMGMRIEWLPEAGLESAEAAVEVNSVLLSAGPAARVAATVARVSAVRGALPFAVVPMAWQQQALREVQFPDLPEPLPLASVQGAMGVVLSPTEPALFRVSYIIDSLKIAPADAPETVGSITLDIPLAPGPFALIDVAPLPPELFAPAEDAPAARGDVAGYTWAVRGLSPQAIHALPPAASGGLRLLVFPGFDANVVARLTLEAAPVGQRQPASRPLESEIINRHEAIGNQVLIESQRRYSDPEGEAIRYVDLMIPTMIEQVDFFADPVMRVEQLADGWTRLHTPADFDGDTVDIVLVGRVPVSPEVNDQQLVRDRSLSRRELLVLERPSVVGFSHVMVAGWERRLDRPVPPRRRHHLVTDVLQARTRRPGLGVMKSYIRSVLLPERRSEQIVRITVAESEPIAEVIETIHLPQGVTASGWYSLPLEIQLPPGCIPASVTVLNGTEGTLDAPPAPPGAPAMPAPSTAEVAEGVLRLNWDAAEALEGEVLHLRYRLDLAGTATPADASILRNASPTALTLPVSVVRGSYVRLYTMAVDTGAPKRLVSPGDMQQVPVSEAGATAALKASRREWLFEGALVGPLTIWPAPVVLDDGSALPEIPYPASLDALMDGLHRRRHQIDAEAQPLSLEPALAEAH